MMPWGAVQACREARAALREVFIPPTPFQQRPPANIDWSTMQVNISRHFMQALAGVDWTKQIVKLHVQDYRSFWEYPSPQAAANAEHDLVAHLHALEVLFLTPLVRPHVQFGEDVLFHSTWFHVLGVMVQYRWCESMIVYIRHDDIAEEHWLTSENFRARSYFN